MVLSWRDARTLIDHAAATGELISDDVAQRIALNYAGTVDPADAPLVALAWGDCVVDHEALGERIGQLLADPNVPDTERTALTVLARWVRSHAGGAQAVLLLPMLDGLDPNDLEVEFALEQCRTCGDHSGVVRIERDDTGRMIEHPAQWHRQHVIEHGRDHAGFYLYTITRNIGRLHSLGEPRG